MSGNSDTQILTTGDKYAAEAQQVEKLLAQNNTSEAAELLRVDGNALAPHELHSLVADLKKDSANLPNVTITDDRNGIKVSVKTGGDHTTSVFERTSEQLAKASDKIPFTGQLLGLSKAQTDEILKMQRQETAAAHGDKSKVHKFGDIAVSLGYRTPEQVNTALRKQDELKAEQLAGDLSRAMPVQHGEGYYQMLKRTHSELSNHEAAHLAHVIKRNNHNSSILKVGEQTPALTAQQESELTHQLYEKNEKATGNVHAQYRQPLDQVPY